MEELVINKLESVLNKYVADIYLVNGTILTDEVWQLKHNPKIKITFKEPVIITNHNKKSNDFLIHYGIYKPEFDMKLFSKPTSWIKSKA